MIQLVREVIDPTCLLETVKSPRAGAIALFLGVTREFTNGRETASLEYDSYVDMAEKRLAELEAEARKRWGIIGCCIVHRLGKLELEDISVAIVVSSAHRNDSLEAARWLIDTLKQVVPIWKKENWADGTTEWVHPGWTQTKQ